jgi:hypothetical protein
MTRAYVHAHATLRSALTRLRQRLAEEQDLIQQALGDGGADVPGYLHGSGEPAES